MHRGMSLYLELALREPMWQSLLPKAALRFFSAMRQRLEGLDSFLLELPFAEEPACSRRITSQPQSISIDLKICLTSLEEESL